MKRHRAPANPGGILDVLRDLMLGGRHSRHTVTRFGVSLPTADRWLKEIAAKIPGVRKVRDGNVSWFEWRRPSPEPDTAETVATKLRGARAIADAVRDAARCPACGESTYHARYCPTLSR